MIQEDRMKIADQLKTLLNISKRQVCFQIIMLEEDEIRIADKLKN